MNARAAESVAAPAVARDEATLEAVKPRDFDCRLELQIAFPQPLMLGVELGAVDAKVRGFLSTGYFRAPLPGGGKAIKILSAEAGVRYFPLNEHWFSSIGVGYRYVEMDSDISSFKLDDQSVATSSVLGFKTIYGLVSLGGDFKVSRHLHLGFDLGAQLPLFAFGDMDLVDANTGTDSRDSSLLRVDSSASMSRIARLLVPEVTLLRMTWEL